MKPLPTEHGLCCEEGEEGASLHSRGQPRRGCGSGLRPSPSHGLLGPAEGSLDLENEPKFQGRRLESAGWKWYSGLRGRRPLQKLVALTTDPAAGWRVTEWLQLSGQFSGGSAALGRTAGSEVALSPLLTWEHLRPELPSIPFKMLLGLSFPASQRDRGGREGGAHGGPPAPHAHRRLLDDPSP